MKTCTKYYAGLDTIKLAEECFSGGSAGTFRVHISSDEHRRFALVDIKVMHNGFAELFKRKDMWKGVLHVYDYLSMQLDPKKKFHDIFTPASTLGSISVLYEFPPFMEQVRGRERLFLDANLRTIKRFRWLIENYDLKKGDWGEDSYFYEPFPLMYTALMLAKRVDPQKFPEIEAKITAIPSFKTSTVRLSKTGLVVSDVQ